MTGAPPFERVRITGSGARRVTRVWVVHQWDGVEQMKYEIVARIENDRITIEFPDIHSARLFDGETLTINHHTP